MLIVCSNEKAGWILKLLAPGLPVNACYVEKGKLHSTDIFITFQW